MHLCTASGTTKADTTALYYSPALEEQVSPHVLSDSVSAFSIGKRTANGCEFHWVPEKDDKVGSCIPITPDSKEIEFKVDEHYVPYLMKHRETTAVPANIDIIKSMVMPAATPASQPAEDPQETGQGGLWRAEDDRASRDSKLRSILTSAGEPVRPPAKGNPFDQVLEPIETDCSEVDAEEEQDLHRRGDKAFLMKDARSLMHLYTHLPKNPYGTSCMRAKVYQKQKRRRCHNKHNIDAKNFGDSVTGDHLISEGVQSNGIDGEAVGFLLRDRATRFKQLYPAAIKTTRE